jgi:RhtB (resistance to homoserine/threonine) family protein
MGLLHFTTFLLAGILLNITPGNDTIFILTRSMAHGRKAGIMSVLGISTGSLIHTTMAAFGLSLIIAKSLLVFNTIKLAGAAYIIYMGFQMVTHRKQLNIRGSGTDGAVNYWQVYRDGVVTNVLNPKVALFFIAFLPQFIDPGFRQPVLSFLILGITFTITGLIWCVTLAVFASAIFVKLRERTKIATYVNKICGTTLIALGIKVAMMEQK